jgi:hypothetical protein
MSAGGGSFPIAFLMQVQGDQEVKSKMQGVGGALQTVGKEADQVNTKTERIGPNFQAAALGISAAATSAVGLAFQFDNLGKSELRVDSAEKNVASSRASPIAAQSALNDMVVKGVSTGADYEQAQLRLSAAEQQLLISQEKAKMAQGDLTQAQLMFGLQVVPTVLSAVTSLSAAKGILTTATVMGTGATTSQTVANLGSIGSFTALSAATTGTSIATKAFALATKLAQIAMGPLGWALLAIGTVFTLVATNAFGIRDALDSFARKVEEIFPILKPVFDFFRGIASTLFPDTAEETGKLAQQFDTKFLAMSSIVNGSVDSQIGAMTSLNDQFADTNMVASTEISALAGNVEAQSAKIVSAAERARKAMASIGSSPASSATLPSASSAPSSNGLPPSPLGFNITTSTASMTSGSAGFYGWSAPSSTNVVVSVELDGKEIATKINKRRLGDEILGRT